MILKDKESYYSYIQCVTVLLEIIYFSRTVNIFLDVNYLTFRYLICHNCIFHGQKVYVIVLDCLLELIIILYYRAIY